MTNFVNRSRWEIIRDILKGIKHSSTKSKTDIYFRSRLTFKIFENHIKDLTKKGMIEVETKKKKLSKHTSGKKYLLSDNPKTVKRYKLSITEKGKQLLQKIEDMLNFYEYSN